MIALPFLLSRPSEKVLLATGAAVTVTLFAFCETGMANRVLGNLRQPTPSWYFAANAGSAFVCAFFLPLSSIDPISALKPRSNAWAKRDSTASFSRASSAWPGAS